MAIGDPGASVGTAARAGTVHVRYGVAGKAGGGEETTLTQADAGEITEAGDRFGSVLRAGYVDGDGCADLVVGVPDEDVGSAADAGIVQVIYGSPGGLGRGEPSRVIRPGSDGVPGTAAAGDRFGATLDVSGPGSVTHAMVVGAPGCDVGTATDAGQVTYVPFVSGHPGTTVAISQDSPGIAGVAESGDHGGVVDSGAVQEFPVGDPIENAFLEQEDLGGVSEPGDHFGASVAYAGSRDLPTMIIGVPDDRTEPGGVVYTTPSEVDGDVVPPPPADPRQKWTATDGTGYGAAVGATVS